MAGSGIIRIMSPSNGASLTSEQQAIADASPESRLLVMAGAGTGKTFTLVARLTQLVDEHQVRPGGILVLSYTRAAVAEIKKGVRAAGGDVSFVRAATFDSFASSILRQQDPDGTWQTTDYDGRIRAAENLDLSEILESYDHILVDEIQDLVLYRADLVKKILTDARAGFTLLGDLAQAIYNYQLPANSRFLGSRALLRWVRSQFPDLEEHTLTTNHRAQSEIARSVWELWPRLCEDPPDWFEIRDSLDDILYGHAQVVEEDAQLADFAGDPDIRTAFLCRTNGIALVQSGALWAQGIPHVLQRPAVDRAVPAWVAVLFGPLDEQWIGQSRFEELCREREPWGMPAADAAWEILRAAASSGPQQIDLGLLRERMLMQYLPDDLNDVPESSLILSTIHRSKGREFDRVVVLLDKNLSLQTGRSEFPEETRVQFVAMSRAREDLFIAEEPACTGRIYPSRRDAGRWIRNGPRWSTWGFEIKTTDVHREDPPGAYLVGLEVGAIQHYLLGKVSRGDKVILRLISATAAGTPRAFYKIEHNGQVIGVTGDSFGEQLARRLGADWRDSMSWPATIADVYVEGVCSVAGTPAASQNAGLGSTGFWLAPRIVGLGSLGDWG